jgi:quercetin dioxygenase-like cupin family protein
MFGPSGVFDPATYEPRSGKTFWMAATDVSSLVGKEAAADAHRQLHDRTTSLPFKFELELISSLSGGTVKEGSPMTVESRIFSVAEYVQPSEGEPIRSVVLETRDSIIVVWHVHPGQEIAAHIHPHGQDTWTVLSGMADYFQGNGIVRALREGEIAVARPGQVHGARNTGTEPFVFVSVVASANAGFVLAER